MLLILYHANFLPTDVLISFNFKNDHYFLYADNVLLSIICSCLGLEMVEFIPQDVLITAVSQVMIASNEKGVRIVNSLSDKFMTEGLYGDNLRLQQILADFLVVSVKYSPNGGLVEITSEINKDQLGKDLHLVHLELRYH